MSIRKAYEPRKNQSILYYSVEVVEPGEPAYLAIRAEFGASFFDDENGGVLRRELLGKHIFADAEVRHSHTFRGLCGRLEAIENVIYQSKRCLNLYP